MCIVPMLVRTKSIGDRGANDARDALFFPFFSFTWFEITFISSFNINLVVSEPLQGQPSFHSFARTKTF